MISEFLARLRGFDKWPIATATVTESELVTTSRAGNWNNFSFYYRPNGSELQSGSLRADSLTSIYALGVGDTFEIQYDPKHPDRFYCKEVNSFTRTFGTIMGPLVIVFVIVLIVSEVVTVLRHPH
jgi:Protein of unknown function (DUF3592)